jgi:poly(A)-specific ribonuclease
MNPVIDPKHTRYQRAQHLHEAGYDSFLTAKNFIKQASQLPEARHTAPPEVSETKPAHEPIADVVDKASKRPAGPKNLSFAELQSKFAHQNLFDTLTEDTDGPEELDEPSDDDHAKLIPSFSSPVWKVYGNKLRVFGTSERVCALDGGDS